MSETDDYNIVHGTPDDRAANNIIRAAAAAHEANRVYCWSIGDYSQPTWEEAPEWQRVSAVVGVEAVIRNPAITPGQLHVSWMEAKIKDGWRHGEVKDPDAKTHPCILPYSMLPAQQRVKDMMFGAVVRAVLDLSQVAPSE